MASQYTVAMHWIVWLSHSTVCLPSTAASHSAVLAVCIPPPVFCTKLHVTGEKTRTRTEEGAGVSGGNGADARTAARAREARFVRSRTDVLERFLQAREFLKAPLLRDETGRKRGR